MSRIHVIEFVFLLVIAPLAFSQDISPQACPDPTPGTLGCEPVEWSRLQEPVPLPEPDPSVPPSDPQPDPQPGESTSSQAQPPQSAQTVAGVIVMEGASFVLKCEDNETYQLDDQSKAREYRDKAVKVVGRLLSGSRTIQIARID